MYHGPLPFQARPRPWSSYSRFGVPELAGRAGGLCGKAFSLPRMTDWARVRADGYAVPTDRPLTDLVAELSGLLRVPDPVARDTHAYAVLASWIGRGVAPSPTSCASSATRWSPGSPTRRSRPGRSPADPRLDRLGRRLRAELGAAVRALVRRRGGSARVRRQTRLAARGRPRRRPARHPRPAFRGRAGPDAPPRHRPPADADAVRPARHGGRPPRLRPGPSPSPAPTSPRPTPSTGSTPPSARWRTHPPKASPQRSPTPSARCEPSTCWSTTAPGCPVPTCRPDPHRDQVKAKITEVVRWSRRTTSERSPSGLRYWYG